MTGVSELDSMLSRMSEAADRDEHQRLMEKLAPLAVRYIERISERFDDSQFAKFDVIWALIGSRCARSTELFCRAIKDSDQSVRWAAAIGLSKCKNAAATQCLVEALKDRSTSVKAEAVSAMKHLAPPSAYAQLDRIASSKHLQTNYPGIVRDANLAMAAIHERNPQPR